MPLVYSCGYVFSQAALKMEDSIYCTNERAEAQEELDEDSVILTLVPVLEEPEKPATEHGMESNISPMGDINYSGFKSKNPGESNPVHLNEQFKAPPKSKRKTSIPLPDILPPINMVTRNTLRVWCRQHKLSTDGQKVEVYARLQKHAYPEQKYVPPKTWMEAKMKPKKVTKEKKPGKHCNIVEVITPSQMSAFACWARIAAKAISPKVVDLDLGSATSQEVFLEKASGVRWCVVHGKLCPANQRGWVRLQFHAGYTWVPDTDGKMISLFLFPACVFPNLDVEDNMLCPECVKRNKKIMQSLRRSK